MNYREVLQNEGFAHIYDWHDEPNTRYQEHTHKGKVTIFVTQGEVTLYFSDGTSKTVSSGERYDVPPETVHAGIVGAKGCNYIVGEMIKGDS